MEIGKRYYYYMDSPSNRFVLFYECDNYILYIQDIDLLAYRAWFHIIDHSQVFRVEE